jgi:hypothetical protein
MPSPHAESFRGSRRAVRWLLPAALLALTPKCVVCVLVYVGAGAALGLGGPEWCRVSDDSRISWTTMCAWMGVAGIFCAMAVRASCRRL